MSPVQNRNHFFCVSENAIFRIPHRKSAPKCRPSAIRGAQNSRIVSASEAPFGAKKNDEHEGISFLQKRIPTAGKAFGDFLRVCVRGVSFAWSQRR